MAAHFTHGAFTFERGEALGSAQRRWSMRYGGEALEERRLPEAASCIEIIDAFADARAAFVQRARERNPQERVDLVDQASSETVAGFLTHDRIPEMMPGPIDDRSRYWLRSADRLRSRPVDLSQFGMLVAAHAATPTQWIASLLPDDVLTPAADAWRAPTSWEIRHVVGENSFTGISGARAAALVGVTPQNFRKYTTADGAATRQTMSYAMWHLLMHRLGVQRAD